MARLVTIGFETNSNTIEWSSTSGSPTIQTTTIRSGKYAGQISSLTSALQMGWARTYKTPASAGPFYARFYIYLVTPPTANNAIFSFSSGTLFASNDSSIILTSTGTLLLLDGGATQIGSASSALTSNTFNYVEIKYDYTNSLAQVVEARLNGSIFATTSSGTIGTNNSYFMIGGNMKAEAQTTGNWFFDDIAINDSTSSTNNSYPGEIPAILAKQNYTTLRPRAFAPGIAR